MNGKAIIRFLLVVVFLVSTPSLAANYGIPIVGDANNRFEYTDDFTTPKFLRDVLVLDDLDVVCWKPGSITNAGPNRFRTLLYRFYGDRLITGIDVKVVQRAAPLLGAINSLYLSSNGLDWTLAATSDNQQQDGNNWQRQPLTVSPQQAAEFTGRNELWVRIVLGNRSGARTNTSNYAESLEVKLEVGDTAAAEADPQADLRAVWGELRQKVDWKTIAIDWADPIENRPPHYYEDSDGWLQPPGANPYLLTDTTEGFPIQRTYLGYASLVHAAPSLAAFVKTNDKKGPLMARVLVQARRDSCRKADVLWDGKVLTTLDTASFFETDKVFYIEIPGPVRRGVHQFRIAGSDSGQVLVRQIVFSGAAVKGWAEKPPLPSGGKLKLLSAYYIPDPKPPVNSQAVQHSQKHLYQEHADFGGIRMVVQNTSSVPVRISQILLNDKPIEAGYINLEKPDKSISQKELRGVVWHRVRPKLLEPRQCSQVFIRFRRRPIGRLAEVMLKLENGKPVVAKVPYEDPGMLIDYVTTGKSRDTLYVYVRRSANAQPGKVKTLTFNGKPVKNAKIYGQDFPGNVTLLVAKFSTPLEVGDYHVVGVETDTKKRVDVQFRVMPFIYMRSSISTPAHLLKQMNMNLATWHEVSLAACEQYDVPTTTQWGRVYDLHQRVIFAIGLDEPDAQYDRKGGRGIAGLGLHARQASRENGWLELIERHSPTVPTWFMLDHTGRPLNWAIYGQLGDIFSTDPYTCTFFGADHSLVRESMSYVRLASRPCRMYATLEAFGWKWSQHAGIPKSGRGPGPAEYRQNVVQAIGVGMKGLTSWVYSADIAGWQFNHPTAKAVVEEIKKVNRLIEHIEDKLLIGTPIDLATSDAGLVQAGPVDKADWLEKRHLSKELLEKWLKDRVWVASLLCGPDTIIVTAVNHIPAQLPNPPTKVEPAENVTVTIVLPDFLRNVAVFEATEDGTKPFDYKIVNGKVILKLASIESGRVFLLKRK